MTTKNGDMPAIPLTCDAYTDFADHCYRGGSYNPECQGITKREMFCLHMGVAETGDTELDEIIRKGNRQKMAMHMMAALTPIYWDMVDDYENGGSLVKCMSESAVEHADALLAELERTNG